MCGSWARTSSCSCGRADILNCWKQVFSSKLGQEEPYPTKCAARNSSKFFMIKDPQVLCTSETTYKPEVTPKLLELRSQMNYTTRIMFPNVVVLVAVVEEGRGLVQLVVEEDNDKALVVTRRSTRLMLGVDCTTTSSSRWWWSRVATTESRCTPRSTCRGSRWTSRPSTCRGRSEEGQLEGGGVQSCQTYIVSSN